MAVHPERVGSYRILDLLGRGGMGVVYRARHERTGRDVALKMVSVLEPVRLEGLRREIHALARLSHPGIVRIHEEGLHLGEPWYAMELVEGRTLDVHAAQEGRDRALEVLPHICDALSYLHGEGLVHRDLKPANVLVRPDGQPVLVDFGVAVDTRAESSRESLPGDVTSVGSYLYIAPEHLRGEVVDARADLYSLGCILCEVLTGAPPFPDGTPEDVLRGHLETPFVLPQGAAVSARLRALLERLLAKQPGARPGFADEVKRALVAGSGERSSDPGSPRAAGGRSPAAPVAARPYVYRPSLVGREELFLEALPRIDALREGRGGILLLRGPGGIGKTRLARELTTRAERQGALVVLGRGAAGTHGPLATLRGPFAALAVRCRERGSRELAWLLGPRLQILAPYAPELRALVREVEEPAPLPPAESILRVHVALTETFDALATSRPVLLVVDDLQWADQLTLGWLAFLARTGGASRALLVLGTLRTDEPAPVELARLAGATCLDIGGLDREGIGELVRGMLASDEPPPGLVDLVAATSAGSPFSATEQVRAAVDAGTLRRGSEASWELSGGELPLPRSLSELLQRRLAGLGSLDVARAVAVLGPGHPGMVREIAGLDAGALWERQSELFRLAILVEDREGRIGFSHDLLREAVLAGLDAPEAARLHALAAEAHERRLREDEASGHPDRIAHHRERAGDREGARPWYLRAARQASSRHAHESAQEHLRAYLALAPPRGPERVEARAELARSLSVRGRNDAARDEYDEAVREALELGEPLPLARTLLASGSLRHEVGDARVAAELIAEARAAFASAGDAAGEARALAAEAGLDQEQGRPEQAAARFEAALDLARRSGDRGTEASVLGRIAILHDNIGNPGRARALYAETLRANRELGDRGAEAMTLSNLGNLHRKLGAMEDAMACYEQSLVIDREIRYVRGEGTVLGNMALVHTQQGRVDEALDCHLRAIELDRRTGSLRGEAISLGNVGCLYKDMGRIDEGRVALEQALGIARRVRIRPLEGQLLGNLGMFASESGDLRSAEELYGQALEIHRAVANRRSEGITLGNLAQLRIRQGRLGDAREAAEQALRIHRELGSRPHEGHTLGILADARRLAGDDPAEVLAILEEGDAVLAAVGEKRDRAKLLCRRGHALLAGGRSAAAIAASARALALEVKAGAASDLGRAVEELERAQRGFEEGAPLVHGELPSP